MKEFQDVFPEEIPRLPPKLDLDFTIDLMAGLTSVSWDPYRMITPELTELRIQIQELLDKGYIRPSGSPWGEPVLFVKKRMELSLCS